MLSKFRLNLISLIYLFLSLSLLFYTSYKSEIIHDGIKASFYAKYYIFSFILILISFVSFFLKKNIQQNLFLSVLSSYLILFTVDVLLENNIFNQINFKKYEFQTKREYDRRDRYQIFNDTKKLNTEVKITLPPSHLYKYNKEIYPLAGISNSETINCNENGEYSYFTSDRFGFNNPDTEWDKKNKLITIIGDSYGMGSCVSRPFDIASNLRKKIKNNFSVINLAYGGNNLLVEYASLREYFEIIESKYIIWLIYEDDSGELDQLSNTILKKYLSDENFSQFLPKKQKIIDEHLNNILSQKTLEYKKNKDLTKKAIKSFKLYNLRNLFRVYNLNYTKFGIYAKQIIKKVKKVSDNNNSNLIVVYVPSVKTIKTGKLDNINKSSLIEILKQENIDYINLDQMFLDPKDYAEYFPILTPGHYNELGYKKISQIIYKYIRNKFNVL